MKAVALRLPCSHTHETFLLPASAAAWMAVTAGAADKPVLNDRLRVPEPPALFAGDAAPRTPPERTRRLILIAGKPSHPPLMHEFRAGCLLLQKCLAGVPGLTVEVHTDGWVSDPRALDGADAVFIYSDGGRGLGFTGGHFHLNWGNDQQRKLMLNALVRLAKAEVPARGVESKVTEAELMENLDPKPVPKPPPAAK